MTYKFELFLVLKNKAHKYKNHSKIMFYMVYLYWTPRFFYTKLTHLIQNLKKFRLDGTHVTKLKY